MFLQLVAMQLRLWRWRREIGVLYMRGNEYLRGIKLKTKRDGFRNVEHRRYLREIDMYNQNLSGMAILKWEWIKYQEKWEGLELKEEDQAEN